MTCISCATNIKKINENVSSFVNKEDEIKFKINDKVIENKEKNDQIIDKKTKSNKQNKIKKQIIKEVLVESPKNIYPFTLGEKLKYNIYALGIKAGNMELEIANSYKSVLNRNVFELIALINTTGIVNGIFPLHYKVKSYTSIDKFDSLRYQLDGYEGKIEKHKIELYDYDQKIAKLYKKEIKEEKINEENITTELLENSVDIIAAFYKIRYNNSGSFKVINSGKNKIVKIKPLAKNFLKEFDNYTMNVDSYELSFDDEKLKDKITLLIESNNSRRIVQILMPLKIGNVKIELD